MDWKIFLAVIFAATGGLMFGDYVGTKYLQPIPPLPAPSSQQALSTSRQGAQPRPAAAAAPAAAAPRPTPGQPLRPQPSQPSPMDIIRGHFKQLGVALPEGGVIRGAPLSQTIPRVFIYPHEPIPRDCQFEATFLEYLRWAGLASDDYKHADFYYIPLFVQCRFAAAQGASDSDRSAAVLRDHIVPYLQQIKSRYPIWNATHGHKHLALFFMDRGICRYWEHRDFLKSMENVTKVGFVGLLPHSPWARDGHPNRKVHVPLCFLPGRDIVLPPRIDPRTYARPLDPRAAQSHRAFLAFFSGGAAQASQRPYGEYTHRAALAELGRRYGDGNVTAEEALAQLRRTPDGKRIVLVQNGQTPPSDYSDNLFASDFVLSPGGIGPWSPGVFEGIMHGSIPVVLADGIQLPFENWLDWRAFAVKIPANASLNVDELLRSVSEEIIMKKRAVLKHAARYLMWPPMDRFKRRTRDAIMDSAFGLFINELQCRMRNGYSCPRPPKGWLGDEQLFLG